MRRIVLLSALLLLLTACGDKSVPSQPPVPSETTPPATQTPQPETSPRPEFSLLDLPAPGDLPAELEDGTRIAFLRQAEAADIALYAVLSPDVEAPELLFRYVDKLQWMGAMPAGATAPYVVFADFDGDGAQELAVVLQKDSTSTLTLYEWDGGWSAFPYDASTYSAHLLEDLDYDQTGGSVTVSYGTSTASYTPGPQVQGPVRLHEDFGDQVAFRVEEDGLYVIFGLGADTGDQVRYFGMITATVSYGEDGFKLYDLRLISNSGV